MTSLEQFELDHLALEERIFADTITTGMSLLRMHRKKTFKAQND